MTIQKCSPLLTKAEIAEIFSSSYLFEKKSFFILEKETLTYNTERKSETFVQEASEVRSAFLNGHTIIVKNLEQFNSKIRNKASEIGRNVDVHMYLVHENGKSSFPFHTDDREVLIHMLYGKKKFFLKNNAKISEFLLEAGDQLSIAKGQEHQAIPMGASCLLSFGVAGDESYFVPGSICEDDLK